MNPELILRIAQANLNEYEVEDWFKERKCQADWTIFPGYERFKFDLAEGTIWRNTSEMMLIVFRGSHGERDWFGKQGNFNFAFSRDDVSLTGKVDTKARVESGFLSEWKMAKDFILAKISDCKPRTIILSGHSRGAAVAAIGAENIAYRIGGAGSVFGCYLSTPRPGNAEFAALHNARVADALSFYYGDDTVVRLPPEFLGYRHVVDPERVPGKNYFLPWNWITFLTSMPFDHYPDLIVGALKKKYS